MYNKNLNPQGVALIFFENLDGAVGVEDAVQVVALVLEDDGGEAGDAFGDGVNGAGAYVCEDNLGGAGDHSSESGDG